MPCIEDTSICEVINEDSVSKDTAHIIDSITEYITQDAYYDSEDEDMLLNDTYNCEVLTQDVYRNSESELTIYNDIEINEMQTHGEYNEWEYEEMITRDIHYDSQVNPEVHVVINDVFFTQNDSDNETMLTQEQYTASTDGIFLTQDEFVASTNSTMFTLDEYMASTNCTILTPNEYMASTNSITLTLDEYIASTNNTMLVLDSDIASTYKDISLKHGEYIASATTSGTSMLTLDQCSAITTGATNTQACGNSVENECPELCKESKFSKTANLCKETTLYVNESNSKQNNSKLLEKLNDLHLHHLIEQYTVTTVNTVSDRPDPATYDSLYKLLKIKDDPISSEHPKLDMYCFPDLFPYGIGDRREEREEQAQPLRYEKTRLMSSNPQFKRNFSYLFFLLQEHEKRKINQGLFASVNNIHGLNDISTEILLGMLKSNDQTINCHLSSVLSKVPNTLQYWAGHRVRLEAQIEKFGPPSLFVTFSPAEYDWVEAYEFVKQNNLDLPNIDTLLPTQLFAIDPILISTFIRNKFDALLEFIKGCIGIH